MAVQVNGLGLLNEVVLVQEFLAGQEYVIDKVIWTLIVAAQCNGMVLV